MDDGLRRTIWPRRDFLKWGGSAALSLVGFRRAAGKEPGFELGLASYTFREFGLEDVMAAGRKLGLRRICLKDVHLPLSMPPAEVRAAVAKIRSSGLVPYGCGVVYMKSPPEVEQAFAYAVHGGFEIMIGVPNYELLDLAETKVRETGVALAIHNHGPGDPLYPTPGSVLERVSGRDRRVGLCLDVGHCARSGIDPSSAARECAGRLLDVHLKDVTAADEGGTAVEVGRGVVDVPEFLRTLAELGFHGTAAFEYEKDGSDPFPGLTESVGYVRKALSSIA